MVDAAVSSRADLYNRSLNHLHVAIAPFLKAPRRGRPSVRKICVSAEFAIDLDQEALQLLWRAWWSG